MSGSEMLSSAVIGTAIGYVFDGAENVIQMTVAGDKTHESKGSLRKLVSTVIIQTFQTIIAAQFLRQALPVIGLGACRFLIPLSSVALITISVARASQRWSGEKLTDNKNISSERSIRRYTPQNESRDNFFNRHIRPLGDHIGTMTHLTIIVSILARTCFDLASIDAVEIFLTASLTCGFVERSGQMDATLSKILDWTRFIALGFCVVGDPVMLATLIGCRIIGVDLYGLINVQSKPEETSREKKLNRKFSSINNY